MPDLIKDFHMGISYLGVIIMGALSYWPDSALYLWNMMPVEVKTQLPSNMVSTLGMLIFVISAVSRIVERK